MRACVVVGLASALAAMAMAGEATKTKGASATGAFVSAEVAGDVVKWQLDLGGDAAKKTFEMSVGVTVTYAEKDGVKQGQSIRPGAGPDRPAREGTVVAKGKFVSAKLDGEKLLVTVKPAEGDKDLEVTLPKQLLVYYRDENGKLNASIVIAPRPRTSKAEPK